LCHRFFHHFSAGGGLAARPLLKGGDTIMINNKAGWLDNVGLKQARQSSRAWLLAGWLAVGVGRAKTFRLQYCSYGIRSRARKGVRSSDTSHFWNDQ